MTEVCSPENTLSWTAAAQIPQRDMDAVFRQIRASGIPVPAKATLHRAKLRADAKHHPTPEYMTQDPATRASSIRIKIFEMLQDYNIIDKHATAEWFT